MAQGPQFVVPEPRQGLMQVMFAAKGKTTLFALVLMMENEIHNVGHGKRGKSRGGMILRFP
jgi:hypothetical protein